MLGDVLEHVRHVARLDPEGMTPVKPNLFNVPEKARVAACGG
jgi:DNA-directed RNA polymerase subunit F